MEIPEKPSLPLSTVRAEGGPHELRDHKDDIFFAAIETTRMPMLVTDPRQHDNPIVFANRAFLAMSGYSSDEVLKRNCRFLQGPATDRESVSTIREAIRSRRQVQIEILNYRKDGTTFWNALFISPVYDPLGNLIYFFASQLDVSRRRDAEEALAQAQKMEALGQLTGGISHDFNNLLQVMSGHLDILGVKLEKGMLDEGTIRRGVENLRSAISKASTLTQQLLAFSRRQRLRGRVVGINAVAQGMSELAARTLGDSIHIEFDLAPNAGNVEIDVTQLEVAILNVLVNSRDAMPGGGTIKLRTHLMEVAPGSPTAFEGLTPGPYAAVCISDSGLGIDPAILPRVMDPFFTTKDEGKGTGLGLSMVYGFVKQSGGATTIESEVGKGTTICMYFPTVSSALTDDSESIVRPSIRGGSEAILIVEDREEVAVVAQGMLEGLGYSVYVAPNAKMALDKLRDLGPDALELLFSDVMMPGGMNGYMLAREVQRISPGVRVLLTTGFDRDLSAYEPAANAEFELLKKPYRLADLARRVRDVLDGPTGTMG
jgi:PAS domain S-box-containing protein